MKPWPLTGSNSCPRRTSRPKLRIACITAFSTRSCVGQHFWFAERRRSPLAMTKTGADMNASLKNAALNDFQVFAARERRKRGGRQGLIPVRNGGNVILQRQVLPLRRNAGAPAQSLNRHAELLIKADGIHDVPAIHAESGLRFIYAVGSDHLDESSVGRREFPVAAGMFLFQHADIKVVGSAEVILGTRAANGWKCFIPIHEELDLTLAPPTGVVDTPRHVGTDVVAAPSNAIQNRVHTLV